MNVFRVWSADILALKYKLIGVFACTVVLLFYLSVHSRTNLRGLTFLDSLRQCATDLSVWRLALGGALFFVMVLLLLHFCMSALQVIFGARADQGSHTQSDG
jgi:hypothetical protein